MASALALYAVRCVGYSLIDSGAYAVVLEAAKPWCFNLVLIAEFAFLLGASPLQTAATVRAVFSAAYFGVGRGLGGLLGGFAVDWVGTAGTLRWVGG